MALLRSDFALLKLWMPETAPNAPMVAAFFFFLMFYPVGFVTFYPSKDDTL